MHDTSAIIEQLKSPATAPRAVDDLIQGLRARAALNEPQAYTSALEWIAADVLENFVRAAHSCAYCGSSFPMDAAKEQIAAHVRVCLKHPVGTLRKTVQEAVDILYDVRQRYEDGREQHVKLQRAIVLLQQVL